jgi:4-amino-4-deoxy-L-arabinose transferase-like glycosyltransferase
VTDYPLHSLDRFAPARPAARSAVLAALAIMLVAVAVRVYGLGRESLWLDEGFTWRLARLPFQDVIAASVGDVHPPLYGLLVNLLARVFGDGEAALRSLSVAASCLGIFFAWRVAGRAFGQRAALGAAGLLALSAFQVRYAQEARAYALLGALALASADTFLVALETGRARDRTAWVLTTIALLYTHAYAMFVLAAEGAALLWWMRGAHGRRWARGMVLPAALVVLAFAPWAAIMRDQVERVSHSFWVARPAPLDLARTLYEFAGDAPMLVLLGVLAAVGLVRPPRPQGRGKAPARALVIALAFLPLLPYAISLAGPAVYLTRAAIPAAFALTVLAAAGWAALPARARPAVAMLLVIASLPPLVSLQREVYKEPWREAVAWLEHEAKPGDLVLVTAPWYRDGVFAYYARRPDLEVRRVPAHEGPVVAADLEALDRTLAAHPRVWLVRARADDPEGRLPAALAAGRETIAHREWLVRPAGLTRARAVRAFDIFCYAAPAFFPPPVSSRPGALKP